MGFRGILVTFLVLGGILVIFRFWGYFGHLLGFGGILVIFWVSWVFWSFCLVLGIFWSFFWVLVVFWSFFKFQGYFSHFLEI